MANGCILLRWRPFFAAALLVFLVSCAGNETQQQKASLSETMTIKPNAGVPPITKQKIALLVPLSGMHAGAGRALQQATELGFFEYAGHDLELIVRDTRGTADGARKAAESVVSEAKLILGPLLSHEVTAVTPLIKGRIPVLAFSNNRSVAAPSTFVLGHLPGEQIDRLCQYASGLGVRNITVFSPENEYGALVRDIFRDLQKRGIIQIVCENTYDPKNPLLGKMEIPGNTQAIFFAEGGRNLIQLACQLEKNGVKPGQYKILGSSSIEHTATGNGMLSGALFAAPDNSNREIFERKYRETWGTHPPRVAGLAYDAISIGITLRKLDVRNPFTFANLLQPRGFSGVDGIFRLLSDGSVERRLAIYEINASGVARVVDPAMGGF